MGMEIFGIGPVCALGSGIEAMKKGLLGEIRPNIQNIAVSLPDGEKNMPVYLPVVEGIERFIPKKNLRRIDAFAQMALLSAYLAVEDAGIEFADKSRVGIIFGTGHGPSRTTFKFLDGLIEDGDRGASPTHFANSVHNALASQVSIFMQIDGPCTSITAFNHTVASVLVTAQNWLNEGTVDYVLTGFGDEYCDVLGYAAASLGAVSPELDPLDFDRCSFLPGEGMVTFLLGNANHLSGKYGRIEQLKIRTPIAKLQQMFHSSLRSVFIAANGNEREGRTYQKITDWQLPVAAHAALYGGMPTGAAFEIAITALSLSKAQPLVCTEYCGEDEVNIYQLAR